MNTQQVIEFAKNLPIDMRIELVEQLQQTITPINPEIEQAWIKEAERRLHEYQLGKVETFPAKQAIKELRQSYSKKANL